MKLRGILEKDKQSIEAHNARVLQILEENPIFEYRSGRWGQFGNGTNRRAEKRRTIEMYDNARKNIAVRKKAFDEYVKERVDTYNRPNMSAERK